MNDVQIKQILMSMVKNGNVYVFKTPDRSLRANLEEISPYVIGYKRDIRGFYCHGLSEKGKALLD